MSRAAQNQATTEFNQSENLLNTAENNSNNLYNQLAPAYTAEATNPQGYGKQSLADLTTSAEQSAGGALGTAVGAAKTGAAANRNAGSFAASSDLASRDASKNLSNANLTVQNQNQNLKNSQQQAGLSGLSGLQGEQNSDVLGSIGLENSSTNALVNAGNSGWFQNMLGLINAIKPGGQSQNPQSQPGPAAQINYPNDDDDENELDDLEAAGG